MTDRTALITGITGQDGAYLAALLVSRGYAVHGLARPPVEAAELAGLEALGLREAVRIETADMRDAEGLEAIVRRVRPDEVYNLAAASSVGASWEQPLLTAQVTGMGALNLLEALRRTAPEARFVQASSAEMFGRIDRPARAEGAVFHPRSPYGVAKLNAHWGTVNAREGRGMHASSAILFNHESPLRPPSFVSRKVTDGVARIALGLSRELRLGNIDARRDWAHARDVVEAMWRMLRQEEPGDCVIATGRAASIRDLCRIAFAHVGLDAEEHVVIDPALFRPADIELLVGDPAEAEERLGWRAGTTLEELVGEMVEADLRRLREAG